VLEAITGVTARVDRLDSAMATKDDLAALRSEMATKAEMSARFDRVDKKLDEMEKDLGA
jgi:hypothetical protein